MRGCVRSFGIVTRAGFETGSNNEWDVVGTDAGLPRGVRAAGAMHCAGAAEGDEVAQGEVAPESPCQ